MCVRVSGQGEYELGVEYLQQAFEIAKSVSNVGWLQRAQVCVGLTRAQQMLPLFSTHTNAASPDDIHRILTWKDRRQDVMTSSGFRFCHFVRLQSITVALLTCLCYYQLGGLSLKTSLCVCYLQWRRNRRGRWEENQEKKSMVGWKQLLKASW